MRLVQKIFLDFNIKFNIKIINQIKLLHLIKNNKYLDTILCNSKHMSN